MRQCTRIDPVHDGRSEPMARVALYLRVSTTGQTVGNQKLELEAWAERAGYEVAAVYADAGISGAKGRDRRPEFDKVQGRRAASLRPAGRVVGRPPRALAAGPGERAQGPA